MSDSAMPASAVTFRHAPWCNAPTKIVDGEAVCSSEDESCGASLGETCCLLMDTQGRVWVTAEISRGLMTPQQALAVGLEIVQAAMLAGAKVA